jgi:putative phage-type endonuclease
MEQGAVITSRAITSEAEWLAWRRQDVTASDVAALFGLHPYKTRLELWAEKSGVDLGKRETAVMRRGRIMEPAVAEAVRIERPSWELSPCRTYTRDDVIRIGATPDFDVVELRIRRKIGSVYRSGLLQAKTVSPSVFAEQWSAESPPFWVVLQAQTELMLHPAAEFCAIAALIIDPWRFDVAIYETEPHKDSHAGIVRAVVDFWKAVDAGVQPAADFRDATATFSRRSIRASASSGRTWTCAATRESPNCCALAGR